MTFEDYTTLETFYKTTLGNGVKTFTYDHPLTQLPAVFRFTSAPKISPLGGRYFRVDMTWEQMP